MLNLNIIIVAHYKRCYIINTININAIIVNSERQIIKINILETLDKSRYI